MGFTPAVHTEENEQKYVSALTCDPVSLNEKLMSPFPINKNSERFNDLRRQLTRRLANTEPWKSDRQARTSLLDGLDVPGISHNDSATTHINSMIVGLAEQGRLNEGRAARPICELIENARAHTSPGSDLDNALQDLSHAFAELYAGNPQPAIATPSDAETKEVLVFGPQRDERVRFDFLQGALRASRAICRVRVPRRFNGVADSVYPCMFGTAWLVTSRLLLTNHHVIEARDKRPLSLGGLGESEALESDMLLQVSAAEFWFDYHRNDPNAKAHMVGVTYVCSDAKLDYALLQISEDHYQKLSLADRGGLPVERQVAPPTRGRRVNIIQHARGEEMRLAIRNNFLVGPGDTQNFIRYQTDTEPGASGSPVCDDAWRVFGLHHASVRVKSQQVPQEVSSGAPVSVVLLNEAVTMSAVLDSIESKNRSAYNEIAREQNW